MNRLVIVYEQIIQASVLFHLLLILVANQTVDTNYSFMKHMHCFCLAEKINIVRKHLQSF